MSLSPLRVAGVAVLLMVAGCAGGAGKPLNLQPGATYLSPSEHFSVVVPPMVGPKYHEIETSVDGSAAGVTFSDDFGVLLDVQSRHIGDDQVNGYLLVNRLPTLQADLDQHVLPGLRDRSSGATVVHRETLTTTVGPALFAVVSLPGGSTRTLKDADGKPYHPDAVRGVLLFSKLRWAYAVSVQLWPETTNGPKLSAEDVNARLLNELRQTVSRMTFNS